MNGKRSLLDKYSIPIENLDFEYIKKSSNVRELEKIVEILKSGEEGFYPDLTKFAENKLGELDPHNRMLRKELKCVSTGIQQRQEMNIFTKDIKSKDKLIRTQLVNVGDDSESLLPPVRASTQSNETNQCATNTKQNRIKAFDYDRWDKFDADTECLKIDLHEERMIEQAHAKAKQQQKPKLIEILPEHNAMSDVEKHELADKHRIKGNEFFKCAEFQQAIHEYSVSLSYAKTVAAFNNRALVHLKQRKYNEAIRDCDECLKLEATNVKALLRKCEGLLATDRKNEAYKLYANILKIDPENDVAKNALQNISLRLEIEDINVQTRAKNSTKSTYLEFDDNNEFHKKLVVPIRK